MQAFATPTACSCALKAASPRSTPAAAVHRVASDSAPKTLRPSAACGTQGAGVAFAALAAVGASHGPRRQRKHVAKATRQLTKIQVAAMQHSSGKKPKVVVLGSGWGCASLMEGLSEEEAQMYDITVVSPRNHFLYTPLLPTATMGSIEERSIVTPIREIIAGKADFLEAKCEHVDAAAKKIRCGRAGLQEERNNMFYDRFPEGDVEGKLSFEMDYDILLYAIGAVPNDFNCPGVQEHAFQFKEVEDARKIRNKISDVFEKAALPMITPEERDALLSFIIVGGGPTGVEVAADLCDFIRDDVSKLYPKLVDHVSVRIIDTVEHLLSSYDRKISEETLKIFKENGVEVLKGVFVKEITATHVKTARKDDGKLEDLPYGCIVWCTGIKQNKLSVQLKKSITEMNGDKPELDLETLQENNLGIVTDEWLQVKGSFGSIFALGDAAAVQLQRVTRIAEELFAEGDVDGGGTLCVDEMKALFKKKADVYPQLAEYAEYFDTKTNEVEPDTVRLAVQDVFERAGQLRAAAKDMVQARASTKTLTQGESAIEKQLEQVDIDGNMELDAGEFKGLLRGIDRNLRSFPATAQVAAQQGKYLAKVFATGLPAGDFESYQKANEKAGPFTYFHKGALAYLGNGNAAFDVPVIGAITGPLAGIAWKGYETISQVSWKNRALVGWDWVRTEVFGRDTSRF
mmetsp:Transcript_75852/g.183339  ORF Transcript_75852/g.183339 Transcript_75852/m.183339 type:complete len:687 (+) Transcript_75852:73-2133(+)